MTRTLVLGDIHGALRALDQVLDRCNFDPANDRVVFLGDAVDGWPESKGVLDRLLQIPDLVPLLGNHDEWFRNWVDTTLWFGDYRDWVTQGGRATLESYGASGSGEWTDVGPEVVPPEHVAYLRGCRSWYEEDGRVFVHGGWCFGIYDHPRQEDPGVLNWDRSLWEHAFMRQERHELYGAYYPEPVTQWTEVYVGHTATTRLRKPALGPIQACEVWNCDQGCGWAGRLSIMDVQTKEYWTSDPVQDLYPDYTGRR